MTAHITRSEPGNPVTPGATDPAAAAPRRGDRARRTAGPAAVVIGAAARVTGFARHPGAMASDSAFITLVNAHPAQWAAAHLLIGLGLALLTGGIGSVLRLARGKGARFLTAGVIATAIGTLGMGYDALAHGALGYALATQPEVPLALSTHIQAAFLSLPFVTWSGLLSIPFPLGVVLLGIGALRSRQVPIWAGVLLLLSPVGIQVAGSGPLELLGAAPLLIGFAALARAALAAPAAA